MKITRRRLARSSLAGLIAAPAALAAQAPAQAQPQDDPTSSTAREEYRSAARELDGVKLPRTVEPVSRFEA